MLNSRWVAVSDPMLYPVMELPATPVIVDYWFLTIDTTRAFKLDMRFINFGSNNIQIGHYTLLLEVFLNPFYPY